MQAASSGLPTSVKVDAYRQVKAGVWEWWSTYNLQLNPDSPPEAVSSSTGGGSGGSSRGAANENRPRQPSGDGSSGGGAGAAAAPPAVVKGKRHRLVPLSESLQRALPADGKLSVLYGGHTCEAQLSLPTSETRCAAARVWWACLQKVPRDDALCPPCSCLSPVPLPFEPPRLQGHERLGAGHVADSGRPGGQRAGAAAQAEAPGQAQRAGQGGGGVVPVCARWRRAGCAGWAAGCIAGAAGDALNSELAQSVNEGCLLS